MKREFFNWRRAGVGWILCLCLACSTLWNCTRDDPRVEEELEWASRSFIGDDEIDIEVEGDVPPGIGVAWEVIKAYDMGRRLLRAVKDVGFTIKFSILFDNEGNLVYDSEMAYGGSGHIYYSYMVLFEPYIDELLFHEFFHLVQTGDSLVRKSLNDEVEAYMAQYLYAMSKSRGGMTFSAELNRCLGIMARHFNWETGRFDVPSGALVEFNEAYRDAIMCLMIQPKYQGYTGSLVGGFETIHRIFGN